MIAGAYPYICRTPDQIPEGAYSNLRREIGSAIGGSVRTIFPAFSEAFPLTVSSMELHWPVPLIACEQVYGEWLVTMAMEKENLNLFFNLTIASVDVEGLNFEKSHSMLPIKWRELYRWFWSFCITQSSSRPLSWRNTPFSYAARLSLEEFRQAIGAKKLWARAFEEIAAAGKADLNCWMWTEAGDALFLNESARDQKVYHLHKDDLYDVRLLQNPEVVLDRYLAHIVEGRPVGDFSFR